MFASSVLMKAIYMAQTQKERVLPFCVRTKELLFQMSRKTILKRGSPQWFQNRRTGILMFTLFIGTCAFPAFARGKQ
jgi:hypothetical protein